MRSLEDQLKLNKTIRVAGIDDAPFNKERGSSVKVSAIVCAKTRFEGMLWGEVEKDGNNATDQLVQLLQQSKFLDQVNVILTDGIALGGFNIIDLPDLARRLDRPCIAVMRKQPNIEAIDKALLNFSDYNIRKDTLLKAGEIYQHAPFFYQVSGCQPETVGKVLSYLTDNGNVPEALRLAHLIGSAVMTGQSSNRA